MDTWCVAQSTLVKTCQLYLVLLLVVGVLYGHMVCSSIYTGVDLNLTLQL